MALTDADFDEIFMDARERLIAWQKMYFSGRRAPYVQATNQAIAQYNQPPEQPQPPAEAPLPEQPAMPAPAVQPEDTSNGMGLA